jgi:hypothetical protein
MFTLQQQVTQNQNFSLGFDPIEIRTSVEVVVYWKYHLRDGFFEEAHLDHLGNFQT